MILIQRNVVVVTELVVSRTQCIVSVSIQLKLGFTVLFFLTIPDAISLANFTLCIHGKGSSMSWRRSFSVPPGIYSVTRFSFLSLYSTPRNLRACGWSKFRSTETLNITWHYYLQLCALWKFSLIVIVKQWLRKKLNTTFLSYISNVRYLFQEIVLCFHIKFK